MRLAALALCLLMAACAGGPQASEVLLLGEQHDAPRHQELHRERIAALAASGRLAGVALEMAERGGSTAGLPVDVPEAEVRRALFWDEKAWPWAAYAPAVMAAVRAGVPVAGANLPRGAMRDAMSDATWDEALDSTALAAQRDAIREGHCGLLAEQQLPGMVRIQVARDRAMADTLLTLARPGKVAVLVSGAGHADPRLGVPRHLPASVVTHIERWPAEPATEDHCAALRARLKPAG